MAASRPTMTGDAPSERAKATRMTPPQKAPDMLAQARSRTSARCPAASASGVTVATGSSIRSRGFYQAARARGVSAYRESSCGQRVQVALQHGEFGVGRPAASGDHGDDVAPEAFARVPAEETGTDQQLRQRRRRE